MTDRKFVSGRIAQSRGKNRKRGRERKEKARGSLAEKERKRNWLAGWLTDWQCDFGFLYLRRDRPRVFACGETFH